MAQPPYFNSFHTLEPPQTLFLWRNSPLLKNRHWFCTAWQSTSYLLSPVVSLLVDCRSSFPAVSLSSCTRLCTPPNTGTAPRSQPELGSPARHWPSSFSLSSLQDLNQIARPSRTHPWVSTAGIAHSPSPLPCHLFAHHGCSALYPG